MFNRLLEPSNRPRCRANRLKKRRRPESTAPIRGEHLTIDHDGDQFIRPHNSLPFETLDFIGRHVDEHSSSPPESRRADLERLLLEAELETIRVKLEKQQVVDDLINVRQTVHLERARRLVIEDHLRAISRVVVGLSFDAGMTEPALSLFASPGSTSNLPEKLRRIREHVRSLEKTRESQFEDIGDLEREIDDLRNTFAERELAWWDQTRKIDSCQALVMQIQVEYGMTLWRQRGLELEILSIHRELDGLQDQVEYEEYADEDRMALTEAQLLAQMAHDFIGTQHRLIDDNDHRMGQILHQARILADSVKQQKTASVRQLQAMARGIDRVKSDPQTSELIKRRVYGHGAEGERSSVAQSTDEETLLNISPKKVHFQLPIASMPSPSLSAQSPNEDTCGSSQEMSSIEGVVPSSVVRRGWKPSGLDAFSRGPFNRK